MHSDICGSFKYTTIVGRGLMVTIVGRGLMVAMELFMFQT